MDGIPRNDFVTRETFFVTRVCRAPPTRLVMAVYQALIEVQNVGCGWPVRCGQIFRAIGGET